MLPPVTDNQTRASLARHRARPLGFGEASPFQLPQTQTTTDAQQQSNRLRANVQYQVKRRLQQQADVFGQQFPDHQFSSVIQSPVMRTLKQAQQQKQEAQRKAKLEKFVLLGPAFLLLGGLSWILKDRNRVLNPILKRLGRETLPEAVKGAQVLEQLGKGALGAGGILLSVNGISSGLVSDQPSMVLGNVVQFIPSLMYFFAKNDHSKNVAASLMMLAGALFTTGFANELKNKDAKTPPGEIRRYDMNRFKSVFKKPDTPANPTIASIAAKTAPQVGPQMSAFNQKDPRLKIFFQELSGMLRFTATDHVKLVSNAYHNVANHFWDKPTNARPNQHDKWADINSWLKKPSADKSQLASIFFILGSLPILLFRKNPNIGTSAAVVALKRIGLVFANLSLFSIALNRDDIRGKAPLLGIPLSVLGMGNSKNGLLIGTGNVGESINSIFFSDVAVNGLDTGVQNNRAKRADKKHNPFA